MSYFDGINFICWGGNRHSTDTIQRKFADYYGIQYNHTGGFYCAADHEPRDIASGAHAFLTRPGHYYEYGPAETPSRYHLYLCFNGSRAERYARSGLLGNNDKGVRLIPISNFDRFFMDIREIHHCLDSQPVHYDRAVNLLEGLLLQMRQEKIRSNRENDSRRSLFRRLARDIAETPVKRWDFALEAEHLNMSLSHFRRLFVQHLGCAPGNYVLRCRLKLAAAMLCGSNDKIDAIAAETGFYDPHHFARLFRRYHHLPPGVYRHQFGRQHSDA